jgi:hypothetical protein
MRFSLKELTVEEREQFDELMESIKDGNLSADEYEKKVKEMGKILYDHTQDYFTDLIIDYKEAYNRWQNKQGAPTSFLYDEVGMGLDYLENCLVGVERIIEEESRLDPNYDRSSDNPIISEASHIYDAIRYLQSIEIELKNAMGQQVQSAGSQIPDSFPPQAPETDDKKIGYSYEQSLFNLFPVFEKHSKYLKDKGFYIINRDQLEWVHGGYLLLAGYFGMIQDIPGNGRCMWSGIEKAFNARNLAQQYHDYISVQKGKTAKYKKFDEELRNLVAGRIRL